MSLDSNSPVDKSNISILSNSKKKSKNSLRNRLILKIIVCFSYLLWFIAFSVGIGLSWGLDGIDPLYKYGSICGLVFTVFSFLFACCVQSEIKNFVSKKFKELKKRTTE